MSSENSDVEMAAPPLDMPVYRLAPDQARTWARAADLAIRHMARVVAPPPDTRTLSIIDQRKPLTLTPTVTTFRSHQSRLTLVNRDFHIPDAVRVPPTSAQIDLAIAGTISLELTRRPSDFLVPGLLTWTCPLPTCDHAIRVRSLSAEQADVLADATIGAEPPVVEFGDGDYIVANSFTRSAVDIIALKHYEVQHFRPLEIRHVIHGQTVEGQLAYYWEHLKIEDVLLSDGARGLAARRHEERRRVSIQKALASAAREWASECIQYIRVANLTALSGARKVQHEYAAAHLNQIAKLDQRDGLFEPCAEAGEHFGGHRLKRLTAVRELYKRVVWVQRDETLAAYEERDAVRNRVDIELDHWKTGDGFRLLQWRGTSKQLYM